MKRLAIAWIEESVSTSEDIADRYYTFTLVSKRSWNCLTAFEIESIESARRKTTIIRAYALMPSSPPHQPKNICILAQLMQLISCNVNIGTFARIRCVCMCVCVNQWMEAKLLFAQVFMEVFFNHLCILNTLCFWLFRSAAIGIRYFALLLYPFSPMCSYLICFSFLLLLISLYF